jgi:Kef-type K+ transport system membrane component KefB
MHEQAFIELSIVIFTTLVICGIFRLLKQPIMIGYIIAGILLSPNVFGLIHTSEGLATFSQIGISLLLFMVGLGLNPRHIKEIGKTAFIITILQALICGIVFFLLSKAFGFNDITSLYLVLALTFSSTIVIMKILTDKLTLETLPGQISIGILIMQDLLAMLALMLLSATSKEGDLATVILITLVKGAILISLLAIFSSKVLPTLTKKIASSQEMLLLFSIAWCMTLASLFYLMDFSIEIGALLAGISLSLSPYRYEIMAKTRPLRDFFIMLFFVFLGTQMVFQDIANLLIPIIVFTLLVFILKPVSVAFLMGRLGYTKKTSFLAGLNFSQISEFSLILAGLGLRLGHLDSSILSLLTLIAILSITGTTYFINYGEKIYQKLNKYLGIFEKKGDHIDAHKHFHSGHDHEIILIGYAKMGVSLIESFRGLKKKFLVVDYDPKIIQELNKEKIDCLYGDASNLDTMEELNLRNIKMLISTVKDTEANLVLINAIRQINPNCIIITLSHHIDDSLLLYEQGANYVIMPFHIGGHHTSTLISEFGFDPEKFFVEKNREVSKLLIRKELGLSKDL